MVETAREGQRTLVRALRHFFLLSIPTSYGTIEGIKGTKDMIDWILEITIRQLVRGVQNSGDEIFFLLNILFHF